MNLCATTISPAIIPGRLVEHTKLPLSSQDGEAAVYGSNSQPMPQSIAARITHIYRRRPLALQEEAGRQEMRAPRRVYGCWVVHKNSAGSNFAEYFSQMHGSGRLRQL